MGACCGRAQRGLLGAFTTFSTVSLDAVQQAREGRWGWAAAVAGGGLAVCLLAAGAGLALAWARGVRQAAAQHGTP